MGTIEQHLSAMLGNQLLTIARQTAELDALREALAAEQAKPKAEAAAEPRQRKRKP